MSKKIKAVNIVTEEATIEPEIEETKTEPVEEQTKEDTIIEEPEKVEQSEDKADECKIEEIINDELEKPKPNRKMITCPDCHKTMLEKNFRYQHINVCGKVKQPKLRAKPIEEVIKEKREKVEPPKPTTMERPVKPTEPLLPPPTPDYWELRRQYNNQLKERKTQLVKKLVSKAF